MSAETLTETPSQFEAGSTIRFTEQFTDFPTSTNTNVFVLSLNGGTPVSTASSISGLYFLTVLTGTVTAALPPGLYDFAHYCTSGGERSTAKTGTIQILPNLAVAQTPSAATTMLAALEVAITALSSSKNSSVSFNGQSYTKRDMSKLMDDRVRLQAEIIREQKKRDAARGNLNGGRIVPQFYNDRF